MLKRNLNRLMPGLLTATLTLSLSTATVHESQAQSWSPANPQPVNLFLNAANNTFRAGRVNIGTNAAVFPAFPNNSQLQVGGGSIAQVQTGLFGSFTPNDQWIGHGQNPVIPSVYGLGMYRNDRYAFYNLVNTVRNSANTKDLILGFGTTGFTADPNQRMIIRSFINNGAQDKDLMSFDPALQAVGINEVNPLSTLFVNAINSTTAFRSIFLLNNGSVTATPFASFSTIGQEGNANLSNLPIHGLRTQVANPTNTAGLVALNVQVNGTNAIQQEAEITWQDLNFAGSPNATGFTGTAQDRLAFFFRNNTNNIGDRRKVLTMLGGGHVGINVPTAPITQATIFNATPVTPGVDVLPATVRLDIPSGGVRAVSYFRFSDALVKTDVQPIQEALTRVLRLRPVNYVFKGENGKDGTQQNGFLANEAGEVIPNIGVRADDGFLALDYDGIIPYLVGAIQEQQRSIDQLNRWSNYVAEKLGLQPPSSFRTGAEVPPVTPGTARNGARPADEPAGIAGAKLLQNVPNPANGFTEIFYQLDINASTASIKITDMQGRILRTYNNIAKGNGKVVVNKGDLAPGVYTYSLLLDGKIAATKVMIMAQ